MRLDINSEDRLGITNEILSTFVNHGWNLAAMEMHKFHTFVYIDEKNVNLKEIKLVISAIEGVIKITPADYLPSEQKRRHLNALLGKLPDPIVDVNSKGEILAANRAAEIAFAVKQGALTGKKITELTQTSLTDILSENSFSTNISINSKSFLMDITPVKTNDIATGAVIVLRSPRRLGQQISAIQPKTGNSIDSIIGHCRKMQEVQQLTLRFANLDLPVLIQGETGTGKELFARALHESGSRAKAPFLAINCATLAENLLESELFGYAPGAFTGAQRGGKPGLFELAESGTVFLDEIGEMSVYLQAKLLRFLQDFTFRRIGGTHEIKINIRIICATHRNLDEMTKVNEFRDDLFYRLNVLSLQLPPLRERIEDIPDLVNYFTLNASKQINVPCPKFTTAALAAVKAYPWPGNVRQLQNVIFRTLALIDKSLVDDEDICFTAGSAAEETFSKQQNQLFIQEITSLDSAVAQFECNLLTQLYNEFPSTRKLAKRLEVSHAKISRKLNKYAIGK